MLDKSLTAQDEQPESGAGAIIIDSPLSLADAIHSAERDDLLSAAADPALTGDLALALLKRADLPGEVLEQLAKNRGALKLRKVKIALACHPHTPRHVSVPLIRQFYTFDLMKVALSPLVPADVKLTADETLTSRLKTITLGERLTLARRGSGRIAGALLLDPEQRIMRAALGNSRLTESLVVQAVLNPVGECCVGSGRFAACQVVVSPRCADCVAADRISFAGACPRVRKRNCTPRNFAKS